MRLQVLSFFKEKTMKIRIGGKQKKSEQVRDARFTWEAGPGPKQQFAKALYRLAKGQALMEEGEEPGSDAYIKTAIPEY